MQYTIHKLQRVDVRNPNTTPYTVTPAFEGWYSGSVDPAIYRVRAKHPGDDSVELVLSLNVLADYTIEKYREMKQR